MARVAKSQADLFAAPPQDRSDRSPEPLREPLTELTGLLDILRAADRLPWTDAAATMAQELRALGLAKQAGPAGAELADAILQETERLLSLADG